MKNKLLLCSLLLAGMQVMSELSAQCPVGINYFDVSCYGGNNGSAIATSLGVSPYTYAWSNGQTTQTATGLVAGMYTVTVADANGCTDTQVVTITEPPALTIAASSTADNCGQCNGSITANTSGGTPPYNYSIDGGITFQPGTVFSNLCAGNYTVTVMDASSCITTQAVSIIGGLPAPLFLYGTSCVGTNIQFIDGSLSYAGDPIVSWNWSMPGGTPAMATSMNTSTTYSTAGTYTVSLIVTSQQGCADTIHQQVLVYNPPVANLSGIATGCVPFCNNFTDLSTSIDGVIVSWQWSFPGGNPATSAIQNPGTICYNTPGTYDVSLIVTTNYGCADTLTMPLTADPTPAVFVSGPTAICLGEAASLCASGGTSYLWNPGGQTTACIAVTPTATTTYTVIAFNTAGCSDTATIVVIVTTASASLTLVQDTATPPNPLLWYAYPTIIGTAPFSYLWDFGDGSTSTQAAPTHTYAIAGTYIICLTVTDGNGCIASTCDSVYKLMGSGTIKYLNVMNTTGIEENTLSVNSVFPNPANNMIEVSFSKFVQGEIRITDVTGREVYGEKINSDNVKVDVSTLSVGYYNLSVSSGTKSTHTRMIIAR